MVVKGFDGRFELRTGDRRPASAPMSTSRQVPGMRVLVAEDDP